MIISNLIIGFIGVVFGYCLIRYAYVIVQNTSSIGWAESFMGAGRTVDLYRIAGFLLIILSLLFSVGLLGTAVHGTITFFAKFLGLS